MYSDVTLKAQNSPARTQEGIARAAPTPRAGATGESESSTNRSTFSTTSQQSSLRLVARRSLRVLRGTRPPERASLRQNTTHKTVSRAHCRVRGTFGRELNPVFARAMSGNTRQTGNTRCGPKSASEREASRPRVPTNSLVGDGSDNDGFRNDGARSTSRDEPRGHARDRRERMALDHAPTKSREDACAISWPVRVAAHAEKPSEQIEVD